LACAVVLAFAAEIVASEPMGNSMVIDKTSAPTAATRTETRRAKKRVWEEVMLSLYGNTGDAYNQRRANRA